MEADFKQICNPGIISGSPKWSADSKEVDLLQDPGRGQLEGTGSPAFKACVSQIVSINLETGKRTELNTGPGLKLSLPSAASASSLALMNKGGSNKRIVFRSSTGCTDNSDGPCVAMEAVVFGLTGRRLGSGSFSRGDPASFSGSKEQNCDPLKDVFHYHKPAVFDTHQVLLRVLVMQRLDPAHQGRRCQGLLVSYRGDSRGLEN